MSRNTENNKRLAKNTLVLYARMCLTVGISFYSSRVILQNLGESDFGLFNVLSGFVAMFYMVTTAMSAAVNRFLAYDLGAGDVGQLRKSFCTSVNIELLFSLIVILLGETIGLWFVNSQLVIEESRIFAANIVYQISLLSFVVELVGVPYFSLVVAHEKMKVFAYNTILAVVFRLSVALLLVCSPIDRLIFYALGQLVVGIFTQGAFYVYCRNNFVESKYHLVFEKSLFKNMFSFGGWSFLSSVSAMMRSQGLNIIINIFFGTAVNAAFGIARQLEGHIRQFAKNFIMSLSPQITKSYSEGDIAHSINLTYKGTKYAFLLMFMLGFPMILYADVFMNIWLVTVPEFAVNFVRLVIVLSLIDMLLTPMNIYNQATGDIKRYHIATCIAQIIVIPASYVIFKMGFNPYYALYVSILSELLFLPYRIVVNKKAGIKMKVYTRKVLLMLLPTIILISIVGAISRQILPDSLLYVLLSLILIMLIFTFMTYFTGFDCHERNMIRNVAIKVLKQYLVKF